MELINSLSTNAVEYQWDNLWAICGAPVDCHKTSRIVNKHVWLMRRTCQRALVFYQIGLLALFQVSVRKLS